jgi:AcrR family transcriptional regulator
MAQAKTAAKDRRVVRTRRTLQHALLALMLKRGYDAITVEDICAEADVGRSTFYAHFTSKDDLKRSGLDDHLKRMLIERQREVKAAGGAASERFAFALVFFEHAQSHLDLYKALISKGGVQTTLKMMRQIVTEMVREEVADMRDWKAPGAPPREAVVQYLVGAFMSLLTWWLDSGAKLAPERLDAVFRRLAIRGVA